jgi:hypothetical protein
MDDGRWTMDDVSVANEALEAAGSEVDPCGGEPCAKINYSSLQMARWKTCVASMAACAMLFGSMNAHAFNPLGVHLDSGAAPVTIRVSNTQMADLHLASGLSIPSFAWREWVAAMFSMWQTRSGANININVELGAIAACGSVNDGFQNGINEIGVYVGIACGGATAHPYIGPSGVVEFDICFCDGDSSRLGTLGPWDVRHSIALTSFDFVAVMMHEIGHALGLDHTPETVMNDSVANGSTINRLPVGDDISGMRSVHGVRTTAEHWYEYDVTAGTLGPQINKPGSIAMPPRGTMVRSASGVWSVVRAAINASNTTIFFDQSTYPLHSLSTWTNTNFSQGTMSPVVPASQGEHGTRAIATWARNYVTNPSACYDVRSYVSTDNFASGSVYTTGLCSNREVGTAYAPNAGRFVVAYAHQNVTSQSTAGELRIATSTTGISWTNAATSSVRCWAGAAVGCRADGVCLASCDEGETGRLRRAWQPFSIASNGSVTLGTAVFDAGVFWPWNMQIGSSTWGTPDTMLAVGGHTTVVSDASQSIANRTVASTTSPVWFLPVYRTFGKTGQGLGLASHPQRLRAYVFGH